MCWTTWTNNLSTTLTRTLLLGLCVANIRTTLSLPKRKDLLDNETIFSGDFTHCVFTLGDLFWSGVCHQIIICQILSFFQEFSQLLLASKDCPNCGFSFHRDCKHNLNSSRYVQEELQHCSRHRLEWRFGYLSVWRLKHPGSPFLLFFSLFTLSRTSHALGNETTATRASLPMDFKIFYKNRPISGFILQLMMDKVSSETCLAN